MIAAPPTPALALRGIHAGYGAVDVLFDVSLDVPASGIVALLGPNGAGKSTLMRVISGRLRPRSGSVLFHGDNITALAPETIAQRGVCSIPEGRGIFPNLTVEENLRMWTFRRGTRLTDVLSETYARFPKLGQRRKQIAGTMSGGEQQMLAISRALTTHPSVILFDEISMGLAPVIVEHMYEIITGLAGEGYAILLVEQFADIALEVAATAAVLTQGRIAFSGTAAEVEVRIDDLYFGASDEASR